MFERQANWIPFAKIFTVLAIVAGVSLGLCAVTFGEGLLFGIGMIAFWVSVVGLLLMLLAFVTLSIFGAFGKKVSQPSILPREEDDTKTDKNG
jgi:membrane protein implicated in regulation of membrane protease activity